MMRALRGARFSGCSGTFFLSLLLLPLLFSCALVGNSSKVAKAVPETSVLVPESLLHPSKEQGVAQLIYVAPDVEWASYTKIILNPVSFWRGAESKTDGLSQRNAQILSNYFWIIAALSG